MQPGVRLSLGTHRGNMMLDFFLGLRPAKASRKTPAKSKRKRWDRCGNLAVFDVLLNDLLALCV